MSKTIDSDRGSRSSLEVHNVGVAIVRHDDLAACARKSRTDRLQRDLAEDVPRDPRVPAFSDAVGAGRAQPRTHAYAAHLKELDQPLSDGEGRDHASRPIRSAAAAALTAARRGRIS
jgi:hypothetical protein